MASFTQKQLDDTRAAYAEGALIIADADRRVQYRSRAEMRAIIHEMEVDLGVRPRVERNLRLSATQKGLNP